MNRPRIEQAFDLASARSVLHRTASPFGVAGALRSVLQCALVVVALLPLVGCEDVPPPAGSFYDDRIQPVFAVGCALQTNGCHIDLDGAATGNLDLSSFDALMRRSDVLPSSCSSLVGLLQLHA